MKRRSLHWSSAVMARRGSIDNDYKDYLERHPDAAAAYSYRLRPSEALLAGQRAIQEIVRKDAERRRAIDAVAPYGKHPSPTKKVFHALTKTLKKPR
jgi:hypothetical protein